MTGLVVTGVVVTGVAVIGAGTGIGWTGSERGVLLRRRRLTRRGGCALELGRRSAVRVAQPGRRVWLSGPTSSACYRSRRPDGCRVGSVGSVARRRRGALGAAPTGCDGCSRRRCRRPVADGASRSRSTARRRRGGSVDDGGRAERSADGGPNEPWPGPRRRVRAGRPARSGAPRRRLHERASRSAPAAREDADGRRRGRRRVVRTWLLHGRRRDDGRRADDGDRRGDLHRGAAAEEQRLEPGEAGCPSRARGRARRFAGSGGCSSPLRERRAARGRSASRPRPARAPARRRSRGTRGPATRAAGSRGAGSPASVSSTSWRPISSSARRDGAGVSSSTSSKSAGDSIRPRRHDRAAAREADVVGDLEEPRRLELGHDPALDAAERVQERALDGVLGLLAGAELVQAVAEDLVARTARRARA